VLGVADLLRPPFRIEAQLDHLAVPFVGPEIEEARIVVVHEEPVLQPARGSRAGTRTSHAHVLTKTAEQMLDSICSYCQRINPTGPIVGSARLLWTWVLGPQRPLDSDDLHRSFNAGADLSSHFESPSIPTSICERDQERLHPGAVDEGQRREVEPHGTTGGLEFPQALDQLLSDREIKIAEQD